MKKLAAACGALVFFAAVGSASAGSIVYNLSAEFTAGNPVNLLTATFDDGGGSGSVMLTMEMNGSSTTEFVSDWFFNFTGNSALLSFSAPVITGTVVVDSITHTLNCCKAGPDGFFDIQFAFNTAAAGRFGTGEKVVYTITGIGITASDFDALSGTVSGDALFTAAHVQGICVENTPGCEAPSAWVTIPEPGPALLFGLGSLLAGVAIRRRS